MAEFKKYPSLENHYREQFIAKFLRNNPELANMQFVLTEKIHGANVQVLFQPDKPFQLGKRRPSQGHGGFLAPDESFFDIHNVAKKYEQTIFARMQTECKRTGKTYRLFGEIFGPGVNKGIQYGDEKRMLFFDCYEDGKLMSQEQFMLLVSPFYRVPVVAKCDSLEEALAFDTRFDSKILGIENNECEGVVIKPLKAPVYNKLGELFYIKKKNESFAEKTKAPAPPKPEDPVVTRLNREFMLYVTANRLDNVMSKMGKIESPKQMGEYIRALLEDAKEEFLKDHGGDLEIMDKGQIKKVFNVGGMAANLIKAHL